VKFRLPRGRKHEVVVRDVLDEEAAHILFSQSRLLIGAFDRRLGIIPLNGYGMKIDDRKPAMRAGRGRGRLVGVALQVGEHIRIVPENCSTANIPVHRIKPTNSRSTIYTPSKKIYDPHNTILGGCEFVMPLFSLWVLFE